METRSTEWGHWGLTFISWEGTTRPYAVRIHGTRYFPVGTRGPMDSDPKWIDMVQDWAERAILPEHLDTQHATKT
jgi:hypothetical protein